MKKLMFAAAFLSLTGITALSAKDYNYSSSKEVSLQDTTKKDTTSTDTTKKDTTTTKE
jgi:hypothetical protein